jgi:hypothetical protein
LRADGSRSRQPIAKALPQRGEQRRAERNTVNNGYGHLTP